MRVIELEPGTDLATPISEALADWVHQEAITSLNGHNAILDDFARGRRDLTTPSDDPSNWDANKFHSHYNRQKSWGEDLVAEPENDYLTGRHLLNVLMRISGNARRLRYFTAADQEDYLLRKINPKIVCDVVQPGVADALADLVLPQNLISLPDVSVAQAHTLTAFQQETMEREWLQTRVPQDFGQEHSQAASMLNRIQSRWARVATTSIIMAMGYRGGSLAAVPFLEPKSITEEPAVFYPFAAKQPA